MQKALILALLIGAFLLPRYVTAQDSPPEYTCPVGGTYQEHPELGHICSVPAPKSDGYIRCTSAFLGYPSQTGQFPKTNPIDPSVCAPVAQSAANLYIGATLPAGYIVTSVGLSNYRVHPDPAKYNQGIWDVNITGVHQTRPDINPPRQILGSVGSRADLVNEENWFCPADATPELRKLHEDGEDKICWEDAICDDPLGNCGPDEPPPECDDVVGNCTPPEDDPTCFRGGAGQLVCFEDPNDKCDKNPNAEIGDPPESVYSNCQAGCGFVNDNFLCSETPDIPSLDKCLVTTNGYACPPDIPEPDDDIDNPEKPLPDMVKGDFKDVLKGVETRTDATNKLLADQIARDKENTDAINA